MARMLELSDKQFKIIMIDMLKKFDNAQIQLSNINRDGDFKMK